MKKARDARVFFGRVEVQEGGGLMEEKGEIKDTRLELVLVDYLDETGALMMKPDQVSG